MLDPNHCRGSSSFGDVNTCEDLASLQSPDGLTVKRKADASIGCTLTPNGKRSAKYQVNLNSSMEDMLTETAPDGVDNVGSTETEHDTMPDVPEPRSAPSSPVNDPDFGEHKLPREFPAVFAASVEQKASYDLNGGPVLCTICQFSFSELPGSTPVMHLSRCGHCFCKDHIEVWFAAGRNSCPNCQCLYPSLRGRAEELSARELMQDGVVVPLEVEPEPAGAKKVETMAKGQTFQQSQGSDPSGGQVQHTNRSQLTATIKKYATESLASLQVEATRRLIYAGGSVSELSERLARDTLRLPPGSSLDAARAAYPVKARVEVQFNDGWYRGWVERHTRKSVGVRFDDDGSYYNIPLFERATKTGNKPVKQCSWLIRSLESNVDSVVEDTLQLLITDVDEKMKALPVAEALADVMKLLMAHGEALGLGFTIQNAAAHNLSVGLEPADLRTVIQNLESGLYTNTDEFTVDLLLWFENCRTSRAHASIGKCAGALKSCFKNLMHAYGLHKVYQAAELAVSRAAKRKLSSKRTCSKTKHNQSELSVPEMLVQERSALLEKVKLLGERVHDQVESYLKTSGTTANDQYDQVAQGARLLKGNGDLIESFTEILLRRNQRRPDNMPHQKRNSTVSFVLQANRYIEYLVDAPVPMRCMQSIQCATPAPNRVRSSTEITFRPSQISDKTGTAAHSFHDQTQDYQSQLKVVTITDTKAQVSGVGMGLYQQWCSYSNGQKSSVGPIVVSRCDPGTVAFHAGVRKGMELLQFESTSHSRKLTIGEPDFTFDGVMKALKRCDRPWTMTFLECAEAPKPSTLTSTRPVGSTAVLPLPEVMVSSSQLVGERLSPPMQRQHVEQQTDAIQYDEKPQELLQMVPETKLSSSKKNTNGAPKWFQQRLPSQQATSNKQNTALEAAVASERQQLTTQQAETRKAHTDTIAETDITADTAATATIAAEGTKSSLIWSQQLQREQNAYQRQCCLALETFALSQTINGNLHAKLIDEPKLEILVGSLIVTGALVLYSAEFDGCADSSGSSTGVHAGTKFAVFVEHAVLNYVLFFPPDGDTYNLYLNSDRTLSSITNLMRANINASDEDTLTILDAPQVIARVSRPTGYGPSTRRPYQDYMSGPLCQPDSLNEAVQDLIDAKVPMLLTEMSSDGCSTSRLGVFTINLNMGRYGFFLPADDATYASYLAGKSICAMATKAGDFMILTEEDVKQKISRLSVPSFMLSHTTTALEKFESAQKEPLRASTRGGGRVRSAEI